MVKFFLNRRSKQSQKQSSVKQKVSMVTKYFYLYIEYRSSVVPKGPKGTVHQDPLSFAAIQKADFSGHGFLEIIHPALAVHQIRCSRNQIEFGLIFELDDDVDIDAALKPDFDRIVWKLNVDKYDKPSILERIRNYKPHRVRMGTGDWS